MEVISFPRKNQDLNLALHSFRAADKNQMATPFPREGHLEAFGQYLHLNAIPAPKRSQTVIKQTKL